MAIFGLHLAILRLNLGDFGQVHGMSYTNQPSADLYPVCGCAIDYLYETTLGVSFTMELRPATSGGGGFILP